jgi:hypothetical protein
MAFHGYPTGRLRPRALKVAFQSGISTSQVPVRESNATVSPLGLKPGRMHFWDEGQARANRLDMNLRMATSLRDPEGEVTRADLPIGGRDAPDDLIQTGYEGRKRDAKEGVIRRIDASVPVIHTLSGLIDHLNTGGLGVEIIGEPEPNLGGGHLHRASYPRVSALQKCVRACGRYAWEHERNDHNNDGHQVHGQGPNSGRPSVFGKRSSR